MTFGQKRFPFSIGRPLNSKYHQFFQFFYFFCRLSPLFYHFLANLVRFCTNKTSIFQPIFVFSASKTANFSRIFSAKIEKIPLRPFGQTQLAQFGECRGGGRRKFAGNCGGFCAPMPFRLGSGRINWGRRAEKANRKRAENDIISEFPRDIRTPYKGNHNLKPLRPS